MAKARPMAEGAQNLAGRTKAKSSSTSKSFGERCDAGRPNRRAVIEA